MELFRTYVNKKIYEFDINCLHSRMLYELVSNCLQSFNGVRGALVIRSSRMRPDLVLHGCHGLANRDEPIRELANEKAS